MEWWQWYLVVGFAHNFTKMAWIKLRDPDQRPTTVLEAVITVVFFLIGWIFWPLAVIVSAKQIANKCTKA